MIELQDMNLEQAQEFLTELYRAYVPIADMGVN